MGIKRLVRKGELDEEKKYFNWKIYLEGSECQEERPCRGGHVAPCTRL